MTITDFNTNSLIRWRHPKWPKRSREISRHSRRYGPYALVVMEICLEAWPLDSTCILHKNRYHTQFQWLPLGTIQVKIVNKKTDYLQNEPDPVVSSWSSFHLNIYMGIIWPLALQWRHNECDGVSNRQCLDCSLNRLFRRRSKKTSKLRVTGLCTGNSPATGEFPAQKASNAENVSIWWRHHVPSSGYPAALVARIVTINITHWGWVTHITLLTHIYIYIYIYA